MVIICSTDITSKWICICVAIHKDDVFMRSFEQRIKDNFQQKCEINISNRCILYKAIYRKFEIAKCLLCVHINSNRKALCRLRLSSHRLLIERGRWTSIPRLDRKCTLCNENEDEYHVEYMP